MILFFGFMTLITFATGCAPASNQNAPDQIQYFSPKPEFAPNISLNDMAQMKSDYKSGLKSNKTKTTDKTEPTPAPSIVQLPVPEPTITEPILPEPPVIDPTPEPAPIEPTPGQPIPVEPIPFEPAPIEPFPSPSPEPQPNPNPGPVAPEPTPTPLPEPEPTPAPISRPNEYPRYTAKPTFNVVRARLYPIYRRDTPLQDPFVPNSPAQIIGLSNPDGLQVIDFATKKILGVGLNVKFNLVAKTILINDKKVSVLAKVEVLPLAKLKGVGTTIIGLKESANKNDKTFKYEGSFTFLKTVVTNDAGKAATVWALINFVYLEDYIEAVVPSEVPIKWTTAEENAGEAVKAQAVAARSYGLNTIASSRQNTAREWDVVPTTANQAYFGVRPISDFARSLISSTAGQILTFDDKVILAVFSANSGGYTCSSLDCWGTAVPYLQAREDLEEVKSLPGGSKVLTISKLAFQKILHRQKIIINVNSKAESITTLKKNSSDRVTQITIRIAGKVINLNAKQTSQVLSASFTNSRLLEFNPSTNDQLTVTRHGFGHAIGMSQWGAYAHSRRGTTYQDILEFYYKDTKLTSLAE